ncbi:type III pantothenate kinase [Pseudonocardia sediminis]|uniref:Type III pantothenate kinase n=1 Tax=Pseudonocardia sediminis TaxID=1397368 RepID=A0A4Q7V5Q4_PSEST|nr:type III pantothenate kinase [Pseudonocardia sediminis]RZT88834.1 type III pantothenate kinase [Pseudonocardia sediminis]
MHLCIDVGNTQIALGLYPEQDPSAPEQMGPETAHSWRMRTEPRMTADELEVAIYAMLGDLAPAVSGISALSTVPALSRELRVMLERRADRMPTLVVGPGVRTGVPLLVDHPREVGADRVVNTLAAHQMFGTACVIVDFGTSTNIDVVSARGEFLGGALAPGIEISMEALATRASALRTVELLAPRSVIGKNTVECLQAGVIFGFAGQVDGLVRRIVAELGPSAGPITVLATGGLSQLMRGESETIEHYVPELTLFGLRLTYLRNVRQTNVTNGTSNTPDAVSGRPAR